MVAGYFLLLLFLTLEKDMYTKITKPNLVEYVDFFIYLILGAKYPLFVVVVLYSLIPLSFLLYC